MISKRIRYVIILVLILQTLLSIQNNQLFSQGELVTTVEKNILIGARNEIKNKTCYNTKMLNKYFPTVYENGKKMERAVYPNGDVNPKEGVCADLVIRACRNAKIDLQKLVYEDISNNLNKYGVTSADKFADHRRTWILLKYFKRNYMNLDRSFTNNKDGWLAGDIVIWDIDSKEHLHIGVISDKNNWQRPFVIHNMRWIPLIFSGKTCEQDVLCGVSKFGIVWKHWKILGHFRLSKKTRHI
jgi:hypothetical protein